MKIRIIPSSMRYWIITAAIITTAAMPSLAQTALGTLAKSMKPGEWRAFSPAGWNNSAILSPGPLGCTISDFITQYSDSAAWAKGKLSFLGQTHGSCYGGQFLQYDEASNTLAYGPWPAQLSCQSRSQGECFNHGYDHNTADPVTGDVYYRQYNSRMVLRYSSGMWSKLPDIPLGSIGCCGALKFIPDFGLVFIDGDWGVWRLNMATNTWSMLANTGKIQKPTLPQLGPLHGTALWAEYSAVKRTLLFGGDVVMWGMNSAGAFTRRADSPGLGINYTLETVDPVSGNLLALVNILMYQFDITANTWTLVQTKSPFSKPGEGVIEAAIPEYGVILFMPYSYTGTPVYLYKHSPSSISIPPAVQAPPIPPAPAPADFVTRCATSGVVKCVDFDQPSDIAGRYGANSGITIGEAAPTLDTTVKASGVSSLKFTVPSKSTQDTSGSYFTNFSADLGTQFGAGDTFYYQWRQRFTPEFLTTPYQESQGFKQVAATTGDTPGHVMGSCMDIGITMENSLQRGFPQMYHSCSGSTSHPAYDNFFERLSNGDFNLQNAMPAPFCLYSTQNAGFPKGCFKYVANEWMTFQVGVSVGARVGDEFKHSYVRLWVAREGQPSQLVIDWKDYPLSAGPSAANQRYGKIWLLPYQTGKNPAQVHPVAYTWYDDLIISKNRIADPLIATPTK